MPSLNETINKLKEIHLYSPTLKLYGVHLRNCVTLDVEPASFVTFGQDILNASPKMREEIFNPEPRPAYEAVRRYPAYIEPTKAEQKLDFYSAEMGNKMRGGWVPAFSQQELSVRNIRLVEAGKCIECQNQRGEDGTKYYCRPCANQHNAKLRAKRRTK
jgi:hypothetical protein